MELPGAVRERYNSLKAEYPFCVTLKRINNGFYVYKATTEWDSKRKRIKSITHYLGRITEQGEFIVKETAAKRQETIRENQSQDAVANPEVPHIGDQIDAALLTVLSTNAKANLSYFGRKLGLSPSETYARVKALEKRFGIRYLAEIDTDKLGLAQFIMLVKFRNRIPSMEEIKRAIADEPCIQLAMRLNGKYDLLIHTLTRDYREAMLIRRALRIALGKYDSRWITTPVLFDRFNFIPVREEFLDTLKNKLLKREHAVLSELNKRGNTEFTEIDRKYNFDSGRALYTYHKLVESGVIQRVTLSMHNLPIKYVGLIFEEIVNYGKYRDTRKAAFYDIMSNNDYGVNKYAMVCRLEDPHGALFFMPVFKEGDLQKMVDDAYKKKRGIRLTTAIATEIIIGSLCHRRIDVRYAKNYDELVTEYNVTSKKESNYYNQTGRPKKKHIAINKELGVWGTLGNGSDSFPGADSSAKDNEELMVN